MAIELATREQRLERAREALRTAETATGVRSVDWAGAAPPQPHTSRLDGEWLTVPPALASVIPHGGIRRGSTLSMVGSTTVLLHLTAALAADGAWTAIIAHPDLGLAAAVDAGIDPERVVLIPEPGPGMAEVLGAVVDGFGLVVIGRTRAISERDRRAISQRIRHRGGVLICAEPWPGAEVTLEAVECSWQGLSDSGRLTGAAVVVRGRGRGSGLSPTAALAIDEHDGATRLRDATLGSAEVTERRAS